MDPANEKPNLLEEDLDVNCRLRHGLNVDCLEHIFQHLDSADLYTVGGMNEFYKRIINDFVILKHEFNFDQLYKRGITILQVFERYGANIRKIDFIDEAKINTTEQLIQSITQYCSTDQLQSVKINIDSEEAKQYTLPIQLQKVEKLEVIGRWPHNCSVSVQLSECLRYLRLESIKLDPNFDWTKLKNLTELYLDCADGIIEEYFIEFLRHRPNIEVFHHDGDTFEESTHDVCEAMARYCGNQIRDYFGCMFPDQVVLRQNLYDMFGVVEMVLARNSYDFISGFKNVKKVRLTTDRICGGDLIVAMKRLAENDTIETLRIDYLGDDMWEDVDVDCIFLKRPNYEGLDMRHFSHLKKIEIDLAGGYDNSNHTDVCDPLKLLTVYSSQILANVEALMIILDHAYELKFIEFAPKLRHLTLYIPDGIIVDQVAKILSTLAHIHQERNNGQTKDVCIEIKFKSEGLLQLFAGINGRNESIQLSLATDIELRNYE